MIRLLVRTTGYLCLAGAFVAIVIDGTRSIASGTLLYARVADAVAAADPALLTKYAPLVPGWASQGMQDAGAGLLLELPLMLVLLALAVILLRLGAPREPEIGVRTR